MDVIKSAIREFVNFENSMKKLKETLEKLDSSNPEEQAPAWKPEDLIGKLVRAWDTEGERDEHIGVLLVYDAELQNHSPAYVTGEWYKHIRPLTEAEALALVWRPKPKTRYDWSKAPEWANYAARDANGNAWFYDSCALDDGDSFWRNISKAHSGYPMPRHCVLNHSGFWRDSLERRPE